MLKHQLKQWFENEFIYQGKSISEIAEELQLDWSSVERWRKVHEIPKHSEESLIIDKYGQGVLQTIKLRKSKRYSRSNKEKAKAWEGKTLEEIYGEEKAQEMKRKISEFNTGRTHSDETKSKMSANQLGESNSNYKGGFHSSKDLKVDKGYITSVYLMCNKLYVMQNGQKCQSCKQEGTNIEAHHLLSFSTIFDKLYKHLETLGQLSTVNLAKLIYEFHMQNLNYIYVSLCKDCHRDAHKMETYVERFNTNKELCNLIEEFIS